MQKPSLLSNAAIIASMMVLPGFSQAGTYIEGKDIPTDLRPFVTADTKLLAFVSADLNGDDKPDYVFVVEKQKKRPADEDIEDGQRPLHIAIRQADGKLKLVKTNEKIVLCSTCGGMMGDPFADLTANKKSFTVSHYGGSAWRWANAYQFNYSRKDDTWQLVKVSESSFHTSEPDKAKEKIYTPPRHFGKIDIADFNPEKFKNPGIK
ncbi:hypothetical protein H8L32_14550 [Undibacterium sp. CY18W]|uniref:Uncharacterized protein n=1 Tax=Undibacterium hunanense TaxID=2762292 RepID=A0ABR6ZS55_9BURK|nr:hypothetical protein [Undibacterium hunanense]MBC3918711.1 hypothetical protein [Undibacterium hunanense]